MIDATPTSVSLAWFLVLPTLGRCVLAWLPPGLPGRHTGREVGATWAASFVIAWTITLALGWLAGGSLGANGSAWNIVAVALAAIAAGLGVARFALRPAAMVPRHEPAWGRESLVTRVLLVASLVLAAWPLAEAWRGSFPDETSTFGIAWIENDVVVAASRVALVLLAAHAFEVARCAPWLRGVGCLLVAAISWFTTGEHATGQLAAASAAGIGAAMAVPWLRRGDARARDLSLIAYACAGLCSSSGWMLTTGGIVWLALGTPRPSRRRTAIAAAVVLLVTLAIGPGHTRIGAWTLAGGASGSDSFRASFQATPLTTGALGVMLLVVVFALRKRARPSSPATWNPSGARVGHEDSILLRALVTFLVLRMIDERVSTRPSLDDPLLPAIVLLAISATLAARAFTRAPEAR